MSDSPAPVRSYQRIFTPDRRIYQIDGRRLPVPGGVPLAWIGWLLTTILVILVVSSRSVALTLVVSVVAGIVGWQHSRRTALVAFLVAFAGLQAGGLILDWLAWPLRLVVLPVAAATAAGHVSGDGRPAHRHLISLLALRLRAGRRSLGRPVPAEEEQFAWMPVVRVAADHRHPVLQHGRVYGPARLIFAEEVVLIRRRRRHVVRPAAVHRARRGDQLARVVQLEEGQCVEVRP